MQDKLLIFFTYILIVCDRYNFVKGKAFLGENIRAAAQEEFPATVCIAELTNTLEINQAVFCSGIFVSHTHVVTCEHCLDDMGNNTFRIIAENHDMRLGTQYFPLWWTTFDRWCGALNRPIDIGHYKDNDISIVKINGELAPQFAVPQLSRISPQNLLFGLDAQMAGFGTINNNVLPFILQMANVTIKSNRDCRRRLRRRIQLRVPIDDRYLCTVAQPYAQINNGDSGGPLIFQGLLIGIHKGPAPRMFDQFHADKVNVHVGLERYLEFIDFHLFF